MSASLERKNHSLSASNIEIKETSGKSNHSLNRFIHTTTSIFQRRKSLSISILSKVVISLCKYFALIPAFTKKSESSSANFLVTVVTRTLSLAFITFLISSSKISISQACGLISIVGSRSQVGRIICSTILAGTSFSLYSYFQGVADTNTA